MDYVHIHKYRQMRARTRENTHGKLISFNSCGLHILSIFLEACIYLFVCIFILLSILELKYYSFLYLTDLTKKLAVERKKTAQIQLVRDDCPSQMKSGSANYGRRRSSKSLLHSQM